MSRHCGYYGCNKCYDYKCGYDYGCGYNRSPNPYGYGLGYYGSNGRYGGADWLYISQLFSNTRHRAPVRRNKQNKKK